MKNVRLAGGVVVEVLPADAVPVEDWFGAEFAAQCRQAPDDVEQGWAWDGTVWAAPKEAEPMDPCKSMEEQLAELAAKLENTQTVLDAILMGNVTI